MSTPGLRCRAAEGERRPQGRGGMSTSEPCEGVQGCHLQAARWRGRSTFLAACQSGRLAARENKPFSVVILVLEWPAALHRGQGGG